MISALLAILQARPPLVIERSRGEPAPELEVTSVENAVTVSRPGGGHAVSHGQHLVHHHRCRLPFPRRDAGVEVGERGLEECLTYVGPNPTASLDAGT